MPPVIPMKIGIQNHRNCGTKHLANILAPFGLRKELVAEEILKNLPGWLGVIAGLQTLFGALMLFFIALALRNRFRLR